jgi:hypothetical protein
MENQTIQYGGWRLLNIRCTIAILVNNAFKTVQQNAKDKEDICRRTDAQQRYLTQDFIL